MNRIAYCILTLALIAVFLAFAGSRFYLYSSHNITDEPNLRNENDLELRLLKQINLDSGDADTLSNSIVTFLSQHGEYVQFSVAPAVGGGGIYLIAKPNSSATFDIIWQGQDTPPCNVMDDNLVPPQMAPYCIRESIERRGDFIYTTILTAISRIISKGDLF